jgi:hypothetical protein
MLSRSAIQASGIVVLERNSPASFTFLRSLLRRALISAWVHPIRFKHSATQRSARASCASCAGSPKWLGPGRLLTRSSNSCRNSSSALSALDRTGPRDYYIIDYADL